MKRLYFSLLGVSLFIFFVNSAIAQKVIQPGALRQIQSLQDEKESRTPAQKKLNSQLWYAIKMDRNEAITPEVATLEVEVNRDASGKVPVEIYADVSEALISAIRNAGGEIIFSSPAYKRITARLPLTAVEQIASLPAIKFIGLAVPPSHADASINISKINEIKKTGKFRPGFEQRAERVRQQVIKQLTDMGYEPNIGSLTSNGDVKHKADVARTTFSVNGAGIKIGVLSDSYNNGGGAAANVTSGDLPGPGNPNGYTTAVTVLSDMASGGTDEGRAMLQIIHDLAPGAQLYYATAFISEASFASNILALQAAGCNIICDDVFYYDEPPFQDGIVAQAVNTVTAAGSLYFSSAGNQGNKNDNTPGVWEGDFLSAGGNTIGSVTLPAGGLVHNFGGAVGAANPLALSSNRIFLFWSDPWGASTNDYDLYVLDAGLTVVVASSTGVQSGSQDPIEFILTTQAAGRQLVIYKKGPAATRALHLNTFRAGALAGPLSEGTNGQTHGHSAAVNAFSVAATQASGPGAFTPANNVENFSSDGLRRMFLTPAGAPISGGVTFASGGGATLQKPDITAADGVATTVPGFNPFFGTSAAAPHAAAIAALLKQYAPSLTPAQIRTTLVSTAIDNEAAGVDRDAGAGIVMAFEALNSVTCVLTCPANITQSNDPNQCGAVVNYPAPTITGSCGTVTATPASGSFFPVGTTTVTVTSSAGPSCTFTVTVNDTQPPSITCPANITQSNDPNQCGAVVNYSLPTATDNCPGTTVVATPASGSFFPVGTTTVTVTATDGSGNTATCTFTVTVNDTQPPTITCPSNMNLCGGPQAVSFTVTASDNCPGVTVVSVPASGSTFPVGTTTVTSTATDGSGNTATCSFTITVYPEPTVNPVPNQTRCNNALTAAINFSGAVPGTIFNWTNNTPSIGLAASGTGNIGPFNVINTGTTPVTATITVTPSTNSAIFSQTYNYTGAVQTLVIPAGVTSVNIQAFGAQGNSNAMSVAGGLGGSASGTLAVSGGNTLFINVGGGGSVSVNGGFNGGGNAGSSTCLNARGGGGGGASDVRLNVNTLPARVLVAAGGGGAAGNRISGCGRGTGGGGGAGLYGGGGGAGWPSASLVVPTGGTQVAGGIGGTSSFSAANNGFPGGLGFGGAGGGEVGSNQAGNNTGSVGAVGGGLIGANGTYAGNFVGQSGAGGSSYTGGVTSGSTTPGIRSGNGQVIISYIVPGPATICTGTPTTFTITVNPTPDAVAAPTSQTICSGTTITPIAISGNVSGTTFNWVRNNTATVTGIAASGSGNISGTLTNTTNAPVIVTFTITPIANGCTGPTTTATVTVNPSAVVNSVPSRTVCFGATVPSIIFTSPTTGGTIVYDWTNSNTAIGLGASGTGNLPSFIATNATSAPISGTITVTPTYTNVVSCPGTPMTFIITVAPNTTVDPVPNQTVCANTLTAPVNFTGPVAGTTFTWTNNTTSIGLAASGTGNIPAFTALNATPNPVTATVTVTPNYTIGSPGSITMAPQTATFSPNVRGYWFTAPTSFTMTSLFVPTDASTGPQSIAVVRFNGATPPPVFPGTTNAFTTLFVVQNGPSVGSIPVSIPIAAGDVIGIMGQRATINSYAAGPNNITIAGFPASLTRMGMQFPLTTTLPQQIWQEPSVSSVSRVVFDYTTAVSCPGTQRTFTITVNPIPTITCPANMTVPTVIPTCTAPVTYTPTVTGVPAPTLSYTFSGATTGSGSGSGSGSLFNIGVTTVTITATNICGTVSCSFTITVTDSQIPVISSQPANQTVCVGSNATFSVTSTFAASYQWQSWNGSAWVNIAGATASTYTINNVTHAMNTNSYRVRITGPCGSVTTSNHASLYVNALPTITITSNIQPQLLPGQFITLTAIGTPAGGSFVWRKNGVVIAGATSNTLGPLNVLDVGVYTVTYTDLNGCVSTSASFTISALLSGGLWIYPNPNTGQFHVRFYNAANEEATVTVYNYLGAIVYQKKHMTGPLQYSIIDVDLGKRLAIGTYLVDVRNAQQLRIGVKMISVGRQ